MNGGGIWTFISDQNWAQTNSEGFTWKSICSDSTGQYLAACVDDGGIFTYNSPNQWVGVQGGIIYNAGYVAIGPGVTSVSSSSNGVLYVNGGITCQSTTITSDYRLKDNIEPLALEKYNVDNLKPVYYKYKKDNKENIGLIAHELKEEIPFLVNGEKDDETYQSVNYIGLIGVLIKEIQQVKTEIKDIKLSLLSLHTIL